MIIRIEELQSICSTVLSVMDLNELSTLTETLELKTKDNFLYLSVTNREYFVKIKIEMDEIINFHATVNAKLFLKLISQITTDTVELNIKGNSLEVKGNGNYTLPIIFDNDTILELPEININNPTTEFNISTNILNSIAKYNSKELTKSVIANPVQSLYYIDEKGCITFTSGACVNNFTLSSPIKILINNKIVKLFKLFNSENVKLTLGYDKISEDIIQTKLKLTNNTVEITAILTSTTALINSVPVEAIRNRANDIYNYSITINKNLLLQSINRLLLFVYGYNNKEILKPYGKFKFKDSSVVIYDITNTNKEELFYQNKTSGVVDNNNYDAILDLTDIKSTLESCSDEYITIKFGNHEAIAIIRNNIINIIPEAFED